MKALAVVLLLVTTTHTASSLSIRRQRHTANTVSVSNLPPTDQHHHHRHSSLFVRRWLLTSTQLAYYSITSDNDNSSRGVSSSSSSSSSSWLDRTTAKILSSSSLDEDDGENEYIERPQQKFQQQQQRLTSDDVTLITHLMSAHARRGTVSSAVICERLLHRVVMEVDRNSRVRNNSYNHHHHHHHHNHNHHNANFANIDVGDRQRRNKTNTHQQLDNNSNEYEEDDDEYKDDYDNDDDDGVRVTTKMYTVAMDAWAKSQRRPSFLSHSSSTGSDIRGGGRQQRNRDSYNNDDDAGGSFGFEGKTQQHQQKQQHQQQQQYQQQQQQNQQQQNQQETPIGAAAQRAHQIHQSLVKTYAQTKDIHIAPSTISYNAAINAWSKSYHPSAGEMAELLLNEMIQEWKFGNGHSSDDGGGDVRVQQQQQQQTAATGNDRVKPDVVTFTAVIDAWVKCTALTAQDYRHNNNNNNNKSNNQSSSEGASPTPLTTTTATITSSSSSLKHQQQKQRAADRSDELTKRAAIRAKEILNLMIQLGHYDPTATISSTFEPGMRPNCYTYSAVMNALAKSCGSSSSITSGQQPQPQQQQQQQPNRQPRQEVQRYDPAREAQDMLEEMIVKHRRYKERVGIIDSNGMVDSSSSSRSSRSNGVGYYHGTARYEKYGDEGILGNIHDNDMNTNDDMDQSNSSNNNNNNNNKDDTDTLDNIDVGDDPYWFEPRHDEITFPPNTINFNAVLNAWSRASRYDAHAALRAEDILLKRMETSNEGNSSDYEVVVVGDDVHPDALSYALVIHAWLRGCRGSSSSSSSSSSSKRDSGSHISRSKNSNRQSQRNDENIGNQQRTEYTDLDRIERAMLILNRLEAWARREAVHNHQHSSSNKWRNRYNNDDDDDSKVKKVYSRINHAASDVEDIDMTVDVEDLIDDNENDDNSRYWTSTNSQYNKARDLDVNVYNSILLAYSREKQSNVDHASTVMQLLDRMENLAIELNMPSVQPNQRSYSIALGIIATSAVRVDTSLAGYYKLNSNNNNDSAHEKYRNDNDNEKVMSIKKTSSNKPVKPLYAGMAAENILSRMLSNNFRPDAYTFASVLNTYQRIPDGKLEAALAADAVVRGMESLHLHGRIDDPPDVFHYTMLCACWSRSGGGGGGSEHHHGQDDVSTVVINPGERCSEILRHMNDRHADGYPRVKPNIRTYNAVIDSFAYSGKLEEAESMLFSMIDNFESSASRSTNGIEDTELPVRPDSFSFNTVIQQWARGRSADGGRRAELVLDRMLDFHYNGNADVRPDERSFAYIIYHYTKGAGRAVVNAPDRALRLLRKMVRMYRQGYKELLPSHQNKTNAMFAFTSVMDSHSILRRPDSGTIADELFNDMILLGRNIDALRPNTYACLSVLYAWSSCGSVDAGERATELLLRMEQDMNESISSRGEESRMKTTQRCYILAQTAWARCPSERKSVGAYEVLEMMENCYARGNKDAKPSVQAYSMVLNACAFADTYQDEMTGNVVKATLDNQLSAFHVAKMTFDRICKEPYINVRPTPVIYGTFIKCCGRLDLPESLVIDSAKHAFHICCNAGFVSDFVLTQLRCALSPEMFLSTLVMNGYSNIDKRGKSISRDGKRLRHIGINDLPKEWTRNVETNINNNKNYR